MADIGLLLKKKKFSRNNDNEKFAQLQEQRANFVSFYNYKKNLKSSMHYSTKSVDLQNMHDLPGTHIPGRSGAVILPAAQGIFGVFP